ncbi:MAG: T9SS type A sorting domain-containing protein [Ignavibacteria bacterium]|nr:T9SS type A sorting domain-containing protein [Ignavibacteria bacterium]
MSANHNSQPDNNTRLEALFGALRERESLLTDDEIRNIVRTEAARTSAPQKASRSVGFPQRFFTKKTMLISSVVAAVFASAVFLTSSLFWNTPASQTSIKAGLTEKTQIEQKPLITNPTNTIRPDTQISSQQSVVHSAIGTETAVRTNSVEGAHILELNETELLRLGLVLDSLGGIHKAIKRPPTRLEREAYQILNKPIHEIDSLTRFDFVAVLPPLHVPIWYAAQFGKAYQRWFQLGNQRYQDEIRRASEKDISRFVPRNQWNAARVDSIKSIFDKQSKEMMLALSKVVEAEIKNEDLLRMQHQARLPNYGSLPNIHIVFARSSMGDELLVTQANTSQAVMAIDDFSNEELADSLRDRIAEAKSEKESDSLELALRAIYTPTSPARARWQTDSLQKITLQDVKDTIPTSSLIGITIRRDTNSMTLWCRVSPEVIAALPDRYRIPLERELAAAQKYSSLCEIPNREEREELERVIAGKPFLETWRSCAGALTAKSIAPNPAQHEATVRFSLSVPRSVSAALHDIRGQHLETLHTAQNFGTGEHTLSVNLTKHIAGMYLLVLTTQQGEQTVQRVMIEK